MKLRALPVVLLVVFSACHEDTPAPITPPPPPVTPPPPPPVVPDPEITLLTFKQDVSSSTSFSDDWIFVTKENGDVLGINHFEAEETIVLKSDKVKASDKINVTIFHYRQPTTETIDFTSYLGITPGQTWVYNKIGGAVPTKTGTATLKIVNAPVSVVPLPVTVSTNLGHSSTTGATPTSVSIPLYKSTERILARINLNNTPSYFESNNVQDGVTFEADYTTDFKPLENIFTIDLSGIDAFLGNVHAITNETGVDPYYINGFLNYSYTVYTTPATAKSYKWGYNSGYDLYRTSFGIGVGKSSLQYFKLGSPVTTIPFPNHTFTPAKKELNGFAFTISGDYQLRNSRWTVSIPDYQAVLSWRVYSPADGKQVFPKIPDEIKNLYPLLSIESLILKDNAFTNHLDGFTYADFINGQMNISSSKKAYSVEYQKAIFQE